MSLFIIDVESDGPAPGIYSMVCFGAIKVQRDLINAPTFYGQTKPLKNALYNPEALAVSGFNRAQHETFADPGEEMYRFNNWVRANEDGKDFGPRSIFMSDNPAYDFQFINYYCVLYGIMNPFGHSARRIGDLYAGCMKDFRAASKWKSLRRTKHTHNPVDDARGNAEALITIADAFDLRLPGVARILKPEISNKVN